MRPRSALATAGGLVGVVALAAALSTPATPVTASVGTGGGRVVARAVAAVFALLAVVAAPLLLPALGREGLTESIDLRLAAVMILLAGVLAAVVAFLLANASGGGTSLPAGTGSGPLGAADQSTPDTTTGPGGTGLAGLAVVAAVGLAGAGLLWLRLRTTTDTPTEADDADTAATRAAVAATAGTAAERLVRGDRPVDNVVYRAWREMTAALDVGAPASTTPGEFAAAAVDAGFDADAVADLTDVFETVRYGDEAPEAYADRARRALERMEATTDGGGPEP
ncbi:DUF4129 domain-containing protein [Haloarchaeobius iranensis]|uniref:Protein-glutamine gamma-glutamyltransferase-like C-terminal domain-containing protein n=1 Tax=Haloarchaeobius iranensis TaxID=996166 RepID=A0A1G9Y7Y8_9EURY|nr:DUF4129 domain-containing protein [Haloarchaeobius iranensis]SDN04756.1 protein of unknown function [Haloarchaeobius iranensis]